MKNLQGLLAFVEAADSGSLAAAAERLDVTPAAVSKGLAKLEAQLGVRLFNRSTRRIALTPEGAGFLDKARAALRGLDEAVAEVSQAAHAAAGRVRISAGLAFGQRWVLPALPAISAAHPLLHLELELDNRTVDLVAEGCDIAIRGGFIEDSSLVARRICALPVALFATPAYLRRHGVPQRVQDLASHQLVGTRFGGGKLFEWRFRQGRKTVDWMPPARLVTSDPEAGLELALADAGITQSGLHHALPYLRSGRLKLVLPHCHDTGSREVVLHYPHRLYLAPRVRVVVDALLAHLAAASDLHLRPAEVISGWPQWLAGADPSAASAAERAAGTPAARATTGKPRARSPARRSPARP